MLTSSAEIPVANGPAMLTRLCARLCDHGRTQRLSPAEAEIELSFGTARLTASEHSIAASLVASDAVDLAYLKLSLAEQLADLSGQTLGEFDWQGDGTSETTPPFYRQMHVLRSRRLSPRMQRLTLAGTDLARFAIGGLHVRLVLPAANRPPVSPLLSASGRIVWPHGEAAPPIRVYTLRRVDVAAGTADIDVVLHPGGAAPGSDFAERACPGDRVGMMGPGGGFVPNAGSIVLFGDETALPAIARICEAVPDDVGVEAHVESDAETFEAFRSEIAHPLWRIGDGGALARMGDPILRAVRELDWASVGPRLFVWAACEAATARAIRTLLRDDLGLERNRYAVAAYWQRTSNDASA